MGTWTDLVDKSVGFIVDNTLWNLIAGATGNIMGVKNDFGFWNECLNSDFGRRTVFGLAMPEVLADLSAWTSVTGAIGSVASNIWTAGATGAWKAKWIGSDSYWRDGRWSATLKLTSDGGEYIAVEKFADTNNFVEARLAGGGTDLFILTKTIAGTPTTVASVAQAPTLNRWYWPELECQGTIYIAKIYDTGGTTPGVTKASSTLLQTLTGTISDAGVTSGGFAVASSVTTAVQIGGIATGNGGVYVETWGPESYAFTFGGTLGGQAWSYDEAADSGPLSKQWALRMYIPATSRNITALQTTVDGSVDPSTTYENSIYLKVSGLGGSGTLARSYVQFANSAGTGSGLMSVLADGGATTWTRKTGTPTASAAGDRRALIRCQANADGTATGTAYFQLLQFEKGTTATVWRNAPADSAPLKYRLTVPSTNLTTTSAAAVEIDPRDLAANIVLPWDAVVDVEFDGTVSNGTAGQTMYMSATMNGGAINSGGSGAKGVTAPVADYYVNAFYKRSTTAPAGKHRVAARWHTTGGTATLRNADARAELVITAYRGR